MKRRILLALALVGTLGAVGAQSLPRNETLYITGHQWGPPSSFNPNGPNPAWPTANAFNLIYESLFSFNLVTGELDPRLGATLEEIVAVPPGSDIYRRGEHEKCRYRVDVGRLLAGAT